MSACVTTIPTLLSGPFDDELAALTLQLEELGLFHASGKGKYPIEHPPDSEVAFAHFQEELEDYKNFLADQILAQSIAAAVHTDEVVIENLTAQEVQAHADHRFVLQLVNDDPEIDAPPQPMRTQEEGAINDWMSTVTDTMAAQSVVDFSDDEDETQAGPSKGFAERQATTFKKLAMEFKCIACTDRVSRTKMVTAHAATAIVPIV